MGYTRGVREGGVYPGCQGGSRGVKEGPGVSGRVPGEYSPRYTPGYCICPRKDLLSLVVGAAVGASSSGSQIPKSAALGIPLLPQSGLSFAGGSLPVFKSFFKSLSPKRACLSLSL